MLSMSALGTKQTFMQMVSMSALRGKADIPDAPVSAHDPKRTSRLEFRPLTAGISLRFGCDNLL